MYWILVVTSLVASGASEKLGNIEVITRDELGARGLVPPTEDLPSQDDIFQDDIFQDDIFQDDIFQDDIFPLKNTNIQSSIDEKPESKFISPPALSYLPPVKTPLPIESTSAPQTPSTFFLRDDYLPPLRAVGEETEVIIDTPDIIHVTQSPDSSDDSAYQEISPFDDISSIEGGYTIDGGSVGPVGHVGLDVQEDDHYLEEEPKEGFVSGIRNSKLALFGGIVGAKSAVFEGLRNAKDSLYSGVTGAIAHKAAAFSSLKNKRFNFGGGSQGGHYGNSQQPIGVNVGGSYEGGSYYGGHQEVGIGQGVSGTSSGGSISIGGQGVIEANIEADTNYSDPPATVTFRPTPTYGKPYPIYPPYPTAQVQPVYPAPFQPYPIYRPRPNPLEVLKAKVDGVVKAKTDAVAGAIAKVGAMKEDFKQKFTGLFNKGGAYYPYAPTYGYTPASELTDIDANTGESNYSTTSPTYQTSPVYPTYGHMSMYYNPIGGIFAKVDAKKAAISGAISRVISKLKAPFQSGFNKPSYGYRHYSHSRW